MSFVKQKSVKMEFFGSKMAKIVFLDSQNWYLSIKNSHPRPKMAFLASKSWYLSTKSLYTYFPNKKMAICSSKTNI